MILTNTMRDELPEEILNRTNKMGFPVPLNEWIATDLKDFVHDTFNSTSVATRGYLDQAEILKGLGSEGRFGRKLWGLLSLELWHKQFCDNHHAYKNKLRQTIN